MFKIVERGGKIVKGNQSILKGSPFSIPLVMPIAVSIAMVTSVAGHVHFVLHPDADLGARDHHGVDDRLEAALLDVLLVNLHPANTLGMLAILQKGG